MYDSFASTKTPLTRHTVKRIDIEPRALVAMIEDSSASLRELYLNEVYIKVHSNDQHETIPLWIGRHDTFRPDGCCWVAEDLRDMKTLKLDVLRAAGLGYDEFEPNRAASQFPDYDLKDPLNLDISFDQRFVEVVMQNLVALPSSLESSSDLPHGVSLTQREVCEYDVVAFQKYHNTTSHYKKCIDGYFNNHNTRALEELQKIITVADRGMEFVSEQIDRSLGAEVTGDGNIAIP